MNEIIQINVQFREDDQHTRQSFTFDGVRFQLDTYTNRVDGGWYMDLFDSFGAPLVYGIALATGLDMLYPYRHLNVPPGVLFINDLDGPRQDPTLDSFKDEEVAMYYQNEASASG